MRPNTFMYRYLFYRHWYTGSSHGMCVGACECIINEMYQHMNGVDVILWYQGTMYQVHNIVYLGTWCQK